MNANADGDDSALRLVDIIDFKWLLAGEGIHLHVEKLQTDANYARGLLESASRSSNKALRAAAERLRSGLTE
jgi:hypothetical protein